MSPPSSLLCPAVSHTQWPHQVGVCIIHIGKCRQMIIYHTYLFKYIYQGCHMIWDATTQEQLRPHEQAHTWSRTKYTSVYGKGKLRGGVLAGWRAIRRDKTNPASQGVLLSADMWPSSSIIP